ncbi:MAG: hypothetical protein HKO64_11125 [Xanthomonadales bacterium]|nr:hypothetical protein [Xanthomonadales bacterium]NNL96163.1 hypothetical protein [Xanthomonadales bacterium]
MQDTVNSSDIEMDASALTREDVFTDNRIGTIRRLTPVTPDGEQDSGRDVQYIGSTQIMTPAGALPLNFEIPAANLSEAISGFGEAAKEAVDRAMEELKELQRQAASSIVVPKAGMDPGAVGGGKIQMP